METTLEDVRNPKELGAKLHELREKSGLSLAALAASTGNNPSTIYTWEQGREGGACQIARLSLVLGVRPNDLLLKSYAAAGDSRLNSSMRRIMVALLKLEHAAKGANDRPSEIYADHLERFTAACLTPGGASVVAEGRPEPYQSGPLRLTPEQAQALIQTLMKATAKLGRDPEDRELADQIRHGVVLLTVPAAPPKKRQSRGRRSKSADVAESNESSAEPRERPKRRRPKGDS